MEWPHGDRMVVSILVVDPRDYVADWELRLTPHPHPPPRPGSQEMMALHIASPGKDQNPKFQVRFLLNAYRFHIVEKSENPKSDHCTSGTVCHDPACQMLAVGAVGTNKERMGVGGVEEKHGSGVMTVSWMEERVLVYVG